MKRVPESWRIKNPYLMTVLAVFILPIILIPQGIYFGLKDAFEEWHNFMKGIIRYWRN